MAAPSGWNPWLRRYARSTGQGESDAHRPLSSGDVLRDIDALAATYWDEWTPQRSAAEEFRTKLSAYIRSYYRPPPI